MIFAPVNAVTLGASDLGRIVNGRDGDPDERRPFLFTFIKPKIVIAWRRIGAMPLTRAYLTDLDVRSVAGVQGPDVEELESLATTHKKYQVSLAEAGFNNTYAGSVPTRTQATRPSTDEEKSQSSSGSEPSTR